MLWVYVKGNVGRQYNSNTTFEDVRTRIIDEFDALWTKSHLVNRIIAHVDKALGVYCEADEETVECTNVSADARAADANEDDDDISFVTCSGGSDSESLGDTASVDTRKSYGSDYFSECSEDTGYSDSESE
jgi:hypothetical protein